MLAVGVVRGEHRRTRLTSGVLDAGLDRRTLAEVDRMPNDVRTGAQCDVARAVTAAVVDAHHVVEDGANVRNDVADDGGLIESRNHDPKVVVTRVDGPQITRSGLWTP